MSVQREKNLSIIPTESDPKNPSCDRVRQIDVSPATLSLSSLSRVDYADSILVTTEENPTITAEQWARRVLEGAPSDLRRAMQLGWARLGLQLGSEDSENQVLGWELRHGGPHEVLLGTISSIGLEGELLFQRVPNGWLYATFVKLDSSAAQAAWARMDRSHREFVIELLTRATSVNTHRKQQHPRVENSNT